MSSRMSILPVALFDISSSSVGGAHVLLPKHKNGKPVILSQVRTNVPLMDELTIDRFVADTLTALEKTVTKVRASDTHTQPHTVQLVLASPWYVSQTRTITYRKSTEFICTEKLIEELVEKEIEHVVTHELARFGSFGADGTIVERQLSLVKLNGYSTAKPFGKRATSIELYVTITVAPKTIVEQFAQVVRRAYGTRTIGITTSPFSLFVAARDFFHAEPEHLVMDVGEELTDVAFIKDGFMLYQHSFPVGTTELYRQVALTTKRSAAQAKALIETYRLQRATGITKTQIEKGIAAFRKIWQKALRGALDNGHFGFCLPEECYMVADQRFEVIFAELIKNDPFVQHHTYCGAVTPHFMSADTLAASVTTASHVSIDAPIGVGALFASRLLQDKA